MNPFEINPATDGSRGPDARASEGQRTRHGRLSGWRGLYRGPLIAACGVAMIVSGFAVGAALSSYHDRREFDQAMAALDATKVTPEKIDAALFGPAVGMTSSWYGSNYEGRRTSSGAVFRSEEMTCAHRTLPFGTRLKVEHDGRHVLVTVTDRGPLEWTGKDLDLSAGAFRALAPLSVGVIRCQVRRVL